MCRCLIFQRNVAHFAFPFSFEFFYKNDNFDPEKKKGMCYCMYNPKIYLTLPEYALLHIKQVVVD